MSIASALGLKRRPDLRRNERSRVFLTAKMLVSGQPCPIHLLDLSRHGALAHAADPPRDGEIVWVVCRGVELLARTAWIRGNRFGLAFDSGLPTAKYEILLKEGRRALSAQTPIVAQGPVAA
ncbi:PilZ domain-containing protein [Sphingomonas histidinilytica]|uniref:PilZ domain-containing protein n=2 Tax=Rhizorhabdus histidinilytica TaxID=439228 RepID=A0A1T5CSC1_9SPHN|nr:PilZ domain-containing protein [Rhizorhabdus histidinilytica]MBO9379087.1 PilZ domain-containing protein [Rhizorhabdus histidinilytica]QEH79000.1 PilZ domain-containing protein [Sphingomonas sp. C8-2]SKB62369.1 PilZ domain-containing protein [Rhizorhabdus histidinilytica]